VFHGGVVVDEDVKAYEGCILCAARIEGRKSQLNLIRAVKDLPYQLVLIGKPSPNSQAFYEACQREAGDNVVFLGHVDHDKLPQFYKVAKVHALVSWMETPGLSSLEAGVMGCNIVATKKGDTEDYFKEYAYYCEPDDVASIKKALIDAYEAPFNEGFRTLITEEYTWEETARKTLEGYRIALGDGT